MLVLDATPAYAYNTWNDHRLWSGVGDYGYNNQYYYVDGSAGAYLGTATAAMDDWIYTTERTGITTPISFLRTTYRPASIIDVFRSTMSRRGGALPRTTMVTPRSSRRTATGPGRLSSSMAPSRSAGTSKGS